MRYIVDSGCKWSALPQGHPPFKTVFGFFTRWSAAGVFNLIRDQLRRRIRQTMGTSPHPVAVVIDSQSVKVAATVPRSTSGYDAGKKIPDRKRHIVDIKGLALFVMVTPADVHDSEAAREVLFRVRLMHLEITIVWADSAYAGTLVDWAKAFLHLTINTVSRSKDAKGCVVLPRRWVVERSLAWLLHARRNARDYEALPQHSEAMLTLAAITLMTRQLTRQPIHPNAAVPRPTPAVQAA